MTSDAVVFERLVQEGGNLIATNPTAAAATLRRALSMWQGRPYADLGDVAGLDPEIRRLEGEPLGELGTAAPNAIAFHPTEPRVYVVDAGVVRIHTLDVEELVQIAQLRITRPMVEDECEQYLRRSCEAG